MPVKIKLQKDYLLTEATMELPSDLGQLDQLLKAIKATGKIVAVYSTGGVVGINVEQRTKIPDALADQIRELLGVPTKEI